MSKNLIIENAAFNLWANESVIQWLKEHEENRLEKEVQSSFPNIKSLLYHIMETEKYYLSMLKNSREEYDDSIGIKELFEETSKVSTLLLEWATSLNESSFNKTIILNRSPIEEKYTVAELITHTINHSTYHRGQLIALRSQLRLNEAPKIDFYRYIMEKRSGIKSF